MRRSGGRIPSLAHQTKPANFDPTEGRLVVPQFFVAHACCAKSHANVKRKRLGIDSITTRSRITFELSVQPLSLAPWRTSRNLRPRRKEKPARLPSSQSGVSKDWPSAPHTEPAFLKSWQTSSRPVYGRPLLKVIFGLRTTNNRPPQRIRQFCGDGLDPRAPRLAGPSPPLAMAAFRYAAAIANGGPPPSVAEARFAVCSTVSIPEWRRQMSPSTLWISRILHENSAN